MYGGFLQGLKRATRFRTRRRDFGTEAPDIHVVRRRRRARAHTPAWGIVLPSVVLVAFAAAVQWNAAAGADERIPHGVSVLIVVLLGAIFAVRAWASSIRGLYRVPALILALACVAQGVWWLAT